MYQCSSAATYIISKVHRIEERTEEEKMANSKEDERGER